MKAFRKIGDVITEIRVDVDPSGNPILPPYTTVEPRPEALEGYYVDLVRGEWEQLPIPQPVEPTLDQLKDAACKRLEAYKIWVLDQPVEYEGVKFDADETARVRILGAVNAYQVSEVLPQAWVTFDNGLFPITEFEQIKAMSMAMYEEFNARFFAVTMVREAILGASSKEELEAIEMPVVGYLPGEEIPEMDDFDY